ncbi:hypothetical protein EUGRSUZ_L00684 [Eucalyptus grandis]|uniref:Uncharacterized protein n=1 Tax=Eucalyptus grandis TaxID=71139 RepID=A0A058ZW52_EUCGR|nr:hypothetical protein EUGRSUZ_L00684 [Eucalyptus grandis]
MMMKFSKYCATHWRRFLQKNIIRRNACQYWFMLYNHLRETCRKENMMQIRVFSFLDILHWYFKRKLEEISTMMDDSPDKDDMDLDDKSTCVKAGEMDIDEGHHQGKFLDEVVKNIGKVVRDLRGLGFAPMTKDAYASAISCFLYICFGNAEVHNLASDDFRSSILGAVKGWSRWILIFFFAFLCRLCSRLHFVALLSYLGDSYDYDSPSSGLKSPLASWPSSCYPGIDAPSEGLVKPYKI